MLVVKKMSPFGKGRVDTQAAEEFWLLSNQENWGKWSFHLKLTLMTFDLGKNK